MRISLDVEMARMRRRMDTVMVKVGDARGDEDTVLLTVTIPVEEGQGLGLGQGHGPAPGGIIANAVMEPVLTVDETLFAHAYGRRTTTTDD